MARLLRNELASIDGLIPTDDGFDGRVDVVLFDAEPGAGRAALDLTLAEDVFVEMGRTLRGEGDRPAWISGRLWRPEKVRRALDARSAITRPAGKRSTYRVVVRVLQERSFLRTELRRELTRTVARDLPDWRLADPAQVEIWAMEYQPGRLIAALRLSDARMRQHDGRSQERSGALRPTVAAAMVRLAGPSGGLLVDACCGSGTILAEAETAGWTTYGVDIDPAAVRAATRNVPDAEIVAGDARSIALPDGTAHAVASNLPFGRQYAVDGAMRDWLGDVLRELVRITVSGATVVLLSPSIPRSAVPVELTLRESHPIRLLGTRTTIWVYRRR